MKKATKKRADRIVNGRRVVNKGGLRKRAKKFAPLSHEENCKLLLATAKHFEAYARSTPAVEGTQFDAMAKRHVKGLVKFYREFVKSEKARMKH
jgi:hypothetical protein